MAITLTPAAVARAAEFIARDPSAAALRFGVRRSGCSGWAYVVELTESIQPDDAVFEHSGITVVVDAKSLPLVDGTEIDFVRDGLNRQFVFRNPRATGACGCGESVAIRSEL